MSIRRDPIYVSTEVWRALWVIGKATPSKNDAMSISTTTADEIADTLLRQVIKNKYPQLLEHQQEIDRMEKKLIDRMKT